MKSTKIFDTSTIVCVFQEAKFPKILENCIKRNFKLVIPSQVFDEIKVNADTFFYFKKYKAYFKIRHCRKDYFNHLSRRYPMLHKGEIGVITVGLECSDSKNRCICLLDDDHARVISKKLHLRTAGVVGLALWEKENGDICHSECKLIHENISKSNFRITKDIIDKLIE